jgi:hypothetical protein
VQGVLLIRSVVEIGNRAQLGSRISEAGGGRREEIPCPGLLGEERVDAEPIQVPPGRGIRGGQAFEYPQSGDTSHRSTWGDDDRDSRIWALQRWQSPIYDCGTTYYKLTRRSIPPVFYEELGLVEVLKDSMSSSWRRR